MGLGLSWLAELSCAGWAALAELARLGWLRPPQKKLGWLRWLR